ncbi:hypothetical protein CGG78_24005 [Vibrio parahaemolyticus]|uniref:hypothetical protein n=4 Tax=Vibrio parahaemolyticus TaxID=670 RepID=UPI001121E69C|nr:hypothetical protein [Vibrio parahaemolyticus]MBE3816855.1 hypothetical protein [Vibrio parahaemolyticus]MBE3884742.1 hypothetical protein [Vibrio parahaemolyticus]MBE4236578.1 hypothetical protein [Vibrio parahaemolyticus]MBE4530913.1 hypothetical protein [Vibrio parahaemolyticus]MDF4946767.1 hypothetical protein [Vibrio parahaemolyticus]
MTIENKVTEMPNIESQKKETELESSKSETEHFHFDREKYDARQREFRKSMYLAFTFMFAFSILMFASLRNPGIYEIDKETFVLINQAFNAIVLLVIPFFLGSLGAIARILMAGVKGGQHGVLVVSSGLMAMFSWVGIKSGVLLAIVAPHLEKQGVASTITMQTESSFYTMALVAIAVGMFSSNLYIFINQRVEQLSATKKP